MSRSAPHKALRIVGIVLVILLPVMLALWFAQIRAKAETADQLRLFSRLALQKTELVIREADEARDKARMYQGEVCSPYHQQYLLGIVRGLLYIDDLIYANGSHFFLLHCGTPRDGVANSGRNLYQKAGYRDLLLPRNAFLPWLCDELSAARPLCGGD